MPFLITLVTRTAFNESMAPLGQFNEYSCRYEQVGCWKLSLTDMLHIIIRDLNALLIYRYGDLLALVEDFDEMRASTRVLRQVPSRRASQAATKPSGGSKLSKKLDDDSSSESSDVSWPSVSLILFYMQYAMCNLHCFVEHRLTVRFLDD